MLFWSIVLEIQILVGLSFNVWLAFQRLEGAAERVRQERETEALKAEKREADMREAERREADRREAERQIEARRAREATAAQVAEREKVAVEKVMISRPSVKEECGMRVVVDLKFLNPIFSICHLQQVRVRYKISVKGVGGCASILATELFAFRCSTFYLDSYTQAEV